MVVIRSKLSVPLSLLLPSVKRVSGYPKRVSRVSPSHHLPDLRPQIHPRTTLREGGEVLRGGGEELQDRGRVSRYDLHRTGPFAARPALPCGVASSVPRAPRPVGWRARRSDGGRGTCRGGPLEPGRTSGVEWGRVSTEESSTTSPEPRPPTVRGRGLPSGSREEGAV